MDFGGSDVILEIVVGPNTTPNARLNTIRFGACINGGWLKLINYDTMLDFETLIPFYILILALTQPYKLACKVRGASFYKLIS